MKLMLSFLYAAAWGCLCLPRLNLSAKTVDSRRAAQKLSARPGTFLLDYAQENLPDWINHQYDDAGIRFKLCATCGHFPLFPEPRDGCKDISYRAFCCGNNCKQQQFASGWDTNADGGSGGESTGHNGASDGAASTSSPHGVGSTDAPTAPPQPLPPKAYASAQEACSACSGENLCVSKIEKDTYACKVPVSYTDLIGVHGPAGNKFKACKGDELCCDTSQCQPQVQTCKANPSLPQWSDAKCTARCNPLDYIDDVKCPPAACNCGKYHASSTALDNVVKKDAASENASATSLTSSLAAGAIAGIVIASVVVAGAAVGGGYYVYKKRQESGTSASGSIEEGHEPIGHYSQI